MANAIELRAAQDATPRAILIAIARTDAGPVAGTIPASHGETHMQQLALTVSEACAAARIGRTSLYAAIQRGDLVAAKLGRKTLIRVDDLRAWLARLPAADVSRSNGQTSKAIARATECEF